MSMLTAKKPCPFCGKRIQPSAHKCLFCGEYLDRVAGWSSAGDAVVVADGPTRSKPSWLVPEGQCTWAVAALYCGIAALVPAIGLLPGLAAILTAPLAFRALGRDPHLGGKGRAVAGLVLGVIGTLFNIFVVASIVIGMIAERSGPGPRLGRPLE